MDETTFVAIVVITYALYLSWCRWLEYKLKSKGGRT